MIVGGGIEGKSHMSFFLVFNWDCQLIRGNLAVGILLCLRRRFRTMNKTTLANKIQLEITDHQTCSCFIAEIQSIKYLPVNHAKALDD